MVYIMGVKGFFKEVGREREGGLRYMREKSMHELAWSWSSYRSKRGYTLSYWYRLPPNLPFLCLTLTIVPSYSHKHMAPWRVG